MGDFDEHMRYGAAGHVAASVVFFGVTLTGALPVYLSFFAFVLLPVTLAGAMFPDIDHPSSKPNRFFRRLLFVLMTVVGAGVVGGLGFFDIYDVIIEQVGSEGALPLTLSVITTAGILVGFGTVGVFKQLRPPHRGMTHRVPIGVIMTTLLMLVLAGCFSLIGLSTALWLGGISGGMFFTGFMSHLLCDGVLLQPKTYLTLR
jgi:hypothetical protein